MANQAKAQQFWQEARAHLMKLANAGNPRAMSPGIPRRGASGNGPDIATRTMGGFNVRYGQAPTDADVYAYIRSIGGNPYSADGRTAQGKATAKVAGKTKGESAKSLFSKLAAEYQTKTDEANAANEKRYGELVTEATDLRGRNQDRVGNWGIAAQEDIDERMQESLGDTSANLASRGLGNSTIMDAFRTRTARDTAREQQRVSEMRDSRISEYDTRDTGTLMGIKERRTDKAPDQTALLQLAAKLGEAEAFKAGRAAGGGPQRPAYRVPQLGGGVSPFAAMQYQSAMNNSNPANMAYGMLGGYGMQQGYAQPAVGRVQDNTAMYDRLEREAAQRSARVAQRRGPTGPIGLGAAAYQAASPYLSSLAKAAPAAIGGFQRWLRDPMNQFGGG